MNPVNSQSDHPKPEVGYQAEIMALLLRELLKGPLEFAKLVKEAEGAYPSEVMSALRLLEAEEKISLSESGLWRVDHQMTIKPPIHHSPRKNIAVAKNLPEPHPLDFDWRFTDETLGSLATSLGCSPLESIAVLGAPTFFKYLIDLGANAWLYDKNPSVMQHLRTAGYESLVQCDLREFADLPMEFQWVFADPPWYVEYYEAFLAAAHRMLVPGGHLLLSMLPRLTRPSASTDRLEVIKHAAGLGFDLIEIERGTLSYASPPFEIEALRAEGVAIENWRTGDLFSFVLRTQELGPPNPAEKSTQEQWTTIELGNTTIKVKNERRPKAEPFSYEPVSASGESRLHSVSRRSPSRSSINLWTSRNVALVLSKPRVLIDTLVRIQDGKPAIEVLVQMTNQYGLSDLEARKLKEILDLLMHDAGFA